MTTANINTFSDLQKQGVENVSSWCEELGIQTHGHTNIANQWVTIHLRPYPMQDSAIYIGLDGAISMSGVKVYTMPEFKESAQAHFANQ